jgi:Flp pilus assembly protein CpaB
VLVAAKDLNFDAVVDESDLRWEEWPNDHIPEGIVRKSASPGGVEELQGSIFRQFPNGRAFAAGPPGQRSSLRRGSSRRPQPIAGWSGRM